MIRVVTLGRRLDPGSRTITEHEPNQTLAQLRAASTHPEWAADEDVRFWISGKQILDADYVARDGDILTIAPAIRTGVEVALAVVSILGTAYGMWRSKQMLHAQKRAEEMRKFRPYGFDTPSLTAYGEGFRIPILYGEMRTGGVVIGTRLEQSTLFRLGTELTLLIALCEGPVESIGGLTLDPTGEADYLTGAEYLANGFPDPRFPYNSWQFPAGLRVNGLDADTKTTVVSLRKGRMNQSPIPDWPGAETNVSVGGSNLVTVGQSTSYTTTDTDIWSVQAELFFPDGLWAEGSGGSGGGGSIMRRYIDADIQWRTGTNAWTTRRLTYEADPPVLNPFSYFVDFNVLSGAGPFELRILRRERSAADQNNHGGRVHNAFSLKSLQIRYAAGFEYAFSYPGLALMSVRLQATEQLSGQLNNVSVPVRGRRVRGWVNESVGWTAESWGPTGPWVFPLGNNPAWVFVDFCLDKRYGLGNLISERDLDLPSFRNWADYCDQVHTLDGAVPLLRYDGVINAGDDAFEVLVQIASAGRAVPVLAGGRKLSVKFSYRDSFERGVGATLNQVPDRIPVGVITTSSTRNFEATYTDPTTAPVVIDAQILDASADYEMRTVSLEDAFAAIADNGRDPLRRAPRRESAQWGGVTRRLQARHEIQLTHNFNRLSRVAVRVQAPIDAIPYELGDLVVFQNDALLTGGSGTTQSARSTNNGTVGELNLTKPITVSGTTPRTDFGIWLTDDAGVVREFTVDLDGPGPITIQAGDDVPLWDPVGLAPTTADIQRGTPVAFGLYTESKRLMEVVGTSTTQDLERQLDLVEWSDAMFDMPDEFDETDGMGADDPPPVAELASPTAIEVQGVLSAGGELRMTSSLRFAPDVFSTSPSRRARVYARTRDGRYSLLGETSEDKLENLHLHLGAEYEIYVCRANQLGVFPTPGQVSPTAITVPEFGPAAPVEALRLTARVDLDRIHLDWPHVDDAIGYEVRRGGAWYGSEVVAVVTGNALTIVCPPAGAGTYRIKPRGRSGLYSVAETTASATWVPLTTVATATYLTADVTTGGTAVDVVWNAGDIDAAGIDEGEFRGTWTSDELDVGADTVLYWSAQANIWAVDGGSLGPFTLGQPERFFEVAGGRQSTRLYPGHDFDDAPADVVVDYSDPEMESATLGDWVRVLTETRFFVDGVWGAWAKHTPGRRLAQKMQARLTFDRYALDIEPYANSLVLTAGF